jgi:group I intron endonuclease
MESTKKWTIYCHIHIDSGRRYIGLTSQTMEKRWNSHICKAKNSKDGRWHFPNAIRKYGPQAFSHEILEVCYDLEVANLAEECWIEFYDTRNPQFGFNLAKGGEHTPHPIRKNPWNNPEYRAKSILAIRKKCKDPIFRAKVSASHLGVKLSAEHCAAITASCRGRRRSPELHAKIVVSVRKAYEQPECRMKMSNLSENRWKDLHYRMKVQERTSIAMKNKWQDPVYRSKCISYTDTHKLCNRHGPVLLKDCYCFMRNGRPRIECKFCIKEDRSILYRTKQNVKYLTEGL